MPSDRDTPAPSAPRIRPAWAGGMTRLRYGLVAWWFCFGIYLVVVGTGDAFRWHNDPFFGGMDLRWWHSTLTIPGAVGIAYAIALVLNRRVFHVLGFVVGAFFVLYDSYLLAITTHSVRMSGWGAWRMVLIVVSLATIAYSLRLLWVAASRDPGESAPDAGA